MRVTMVRSWSTEAAPLGLLLTGRSSDGHARDPQRRLARTHRHALSVLATGARRGGEVVGHGVDATEGLGAVADEVGVAQRFGEPADLDEVGLDGAEDEVARGGVDLSAAE